MLGYRGRIDDNANAVNCILLNVVLQSFFSSPFPPLPRVGSGNHRSLHCFRLLGCAIIAVLNMTKKCFLQAPGRIPIRGGSNSKKWFFGRGVICHQICKCVCPWHYTLGSFLVFVVMTPCGLKHTEIFMSICSLKILIGMNLEMICMLFLKKHPSS